MMNLARLIFTAALAAFCIVFSPAASADSHYPLFDGESLKGWSGNPESWRVEDGAIVGQTTKEKPTKGNTFLIWEDGEVDDFELLVDYKIEGGNSGIQIRSFPLEGSADQWRVGGYQSDIDATGKFTGIIYGEQFRGILCPLGKKAEMGDDHKSKVTGEVGDPAAIKAGVTEGWNTFRIVAQGHTIKQFINGNQTAELVDNDTEMRRRGGLLALQLHAGPPMKVSFKNIKLKRLPMEGVKKIALLAGNPSHGRGAHEHRAGCLLLAKLLNENAGDRVHAVVYDQGWPRDASALVNADAVVMFCDGGGRHPAKFHLKEHGEFMAREGKGMGCIHYGVEIPKGEGGEEFTDWIGGYFEAHWSVNPHWLAKFDAFPEHPVTQGVEPFEVQDEWYYHMRFRDGMQGVTPILTALPPADTLKRGDGPHSGNPAVRAAVLERKEPQHMAWVSERKNGGRGFGFTGAHFHKNWTDDNFRKTVLNSLVWIAGAEVPEGGVESNTPTAAEIEANQD